MGKLFGTDGIRGIANVDLTPSLAMKVGKASAYVLGKNEDVTVLIGRDTRISGSMLLAALTSGLTSGGAKVIDLGIVPTPAVSYLVQKYSATMGVMISASHNPSEYNGIKLFNREGYKLADEIEEEIEKYILDKEVPESNKIGTLEVCDTAAHDYIDYLISTVDNIDASLNLVVDCANGSASVIAPSLFEKLGLKANIISYKYDGYNINEKCGSTHLENLISEVKKHNADAGIAYDGDADRCLMIDNKGNIVDGDFIMAIAGKYLKDNNNLTNNAIVGTVMSNLGLRKFCEANNINFVSTKVGDRYVLENMLQNKYIIGGEQSGHIIFKALANTGDGELTSLQILNIMSKTNSSLESLASIMQSYPQILVNVKVSKNGKEKYVNDKEINELIKNCEDSLNGDGRVLIRASGTENLVRVMLEGKDIKNITSMANQIADLINQKYGIK